MSQVDTEDSPTSRAPRVLLVEDEADVALYLSAALEDEGYEVTRAGDAEAGLAAARSFQPDLISLDLVMPGRTGLTLYREVREDPDFAGIPIVVVSGVNPADAADKLGLGDSLAAPDAFIEKPVELPLFLKTIGDLLSGARRSR